MNLIKHGQTTRVCNRIFMISFVCGLQVYSCDPKKFYSMQTSLIIQKFHKFRYNISTNDYDPKKTFSDSNA